MDREHRMTASAFVPPDSGYHTPFYHALGHLNVPRRLFQQTYTP